MYELSIMSDMAAAHYLKGYDGKCRNLHGHTWKVEVVVAGDMLDQIGMLADFGILKRKLFELLETLDHRCLNDVPAFQEKNPTTENIARHIHQHYGAMIAPLILRRVQVWESDGSSVTYYE